MHLIKSHCRHAFHQWVGLAGNFYSIHDIIAFLEVFHHLGNALNVVLQVGINGDDGICPVFGCHHTSHDGILVTYVMSQVNATDKLVFLVQLADNLPSAVAAAIVYKHHHAVAGNQPLADHPLEEGCQSLNGGTQYFLLVVAG